MNDRKQCETCGKWRKMSFCTDGDGGLLDITPPCDHVLPRYAEGEAFEYRSAICGRCKEKPVKRKGVGRWCADCAPIVKSEQAKAKRQRNLEMMRQRDRERKRTRRAA